MEPLDELTEEEVDVYSRQIMLDEIGYEGQTKIKKARVLVVGAGGLGSPAALKLAAMGVGYLRLVDRDIVSPSDLHRQYLYDSRSVGLAKVEVAAEKLKALNPRVKVDPVPTSVKPWNVRDLVRGVDLVVDGLDSIEARYLINRACVELGVPYAYGGAIGKVGAASTIIPRETPCLECFNPGLSDDELPKCAVVGVHPSILGLISSIQVFEAVRLIVGGKPNLAGKLLYVDLSSLSFDEAKLARNEGCPVCGERPAGPPRPLKERLVEEHCARGGKMVLVITPKERLNINLRGLVDALSREGNFKVEGAGKLGATFVRSDGLSLSVLSSGIAVVQVPPGPERRDPRREALNLYKEVFVSKLGLPAGALPVGGSAAPNAPRAGKLKDYEGKRERGG